MNTSRPLIARVVLLVVLVLSANLGAGFAQTTLTNGLVAYWPMDSIVGTNTPDLALGNSLGLFGSPSLVAGERGNCFQFNGTSQFLGLVHTTNSAGTGMPVYTTNGYTIAFWVMGAGTIANNKTMFSVGNLNNSGLLLNLASSTGGKMIVLVRDNAGITVVNNPKSGHVVFDGTWHHVAWEDLNGTCSLFIDGQPDTGSASYNYTAPSAGAPTGTDTSVGALFRATPVNFFTGFMDEVMCWSRVLTQAEIQNAMSNGIPTPINPILPTIVSQPATTTNSLGDRVILTGNFFGNQPMGFQWLSNGIPLTGRTNLSLELTSLVTPGSNTTFALMASNSFGTNTSSPATLVVLPDPTNNVLSGMVSYWPFNTVTNSATPDLVGQNDLQLVNSPGLGSGEFGNALTFDGSSQYGSETTGTPIYDLSTTYTVAMWVNGPPGIANEQTFANGNSTTGSYFFIGPDNTGATGKVDVRVNPGMADTLSTATAFDNTWHHIVWVDQNGNGLLYIDGVLDPAIYNYAHGALGSVALNNTTVGALLANPLRDFYNGQVDDVGTWNRRLTYSEIQAIRASGIPAPPVITKPSLSSVTTTPSILTGNVYQGDTVSFTVSASGTSPFSYHWQTNGAPLSSVGNPTILSNTLVLSNVQPANNGNYSVIVTNAGGSATSSVVQLTVIPYTPVTNGTALQVEFNFGAGPVVQPGFSSMTLNGNPATFNGPQVTLTPIGATFLSDRVRTVPTNNPPALTQADIYSQIIFSGANTPGTGIDILINRLAPNTTYGLTLWSYDSQNSGISDWTEVSSGTAIPIDAQPTIPFYSFTGSVHPTADYQDTLGSLLTSSSNGVLELQGVVDGFNVAITVFINGLQLVANPKIQITGSQVLTNGNLQLSVACQYPNQQMEFQERSDLTSAGSWGPGSDAVNVVTNGPIVTAEFPISNTQTFYRVVSP